jgi:hypothetical protein
MKILSRVMTSLFTVLVLTSVNSALAEQAKLWNETKVLSISDDLSNAARRLRVECRSSPPKYNEFTSNYHLVFRYHVRHFSSVAYQLNTALEDGKGEVETYPMYKTLAGMKNDLTGYAEMTGGAGIPVQKAVTEVEKHLTALGAYYAGK